MRQEATGAMLVWEYPLWVVITGVSDIYTLAYS